jgi:hypothetical protein
VADVGEEKTFVDGDVGGVLVGGGVGGALVGVPLPSYVRLATLLLVVVLLLPFLVVVPVTITCIWTFSNIKIGLTTSVANPFGVGFVLLPIPLLKDLSEALNDKSCFVVVKLGGINWEPISWCRLFLLLFCCFECNGLHLGCGGRTLLQVDNVFGVFDHNLKDHKLTNHILERHFFIPRILTN